jgi:pentatricopeptide repeat protein
VTRIFDEMRLTRGLQPSVTNYNVAMNAHMKRGAFKATFALLEELRAKGLKGDQVSTVSE